MARGLRWRSVVLPTTPEQPPNERDALTTVYATLVGRFRSVLRRTRTSALRGVALLIATLVVAAAGAAIAYDALSADQFLPGTRIGGVLVGSRSVDDARALLHEQLVAPLHTDSIELEAPRLRQNASAWKMGLRIRLDEVVRDTLARQQRGPLIARLWRRAAGDPRNVPMLTQVDTERLRAFLSAVAARINRPPRDASIEFNGGELKVVPHQVGRQLDVAGAEEHLVRVLPLGDRRIKLPVQITEPRFRTEQFRKVILVQTGSNRLNLYVDRKLHKAYPVATGTPGYPTPRGQFTVTAKRRNPSWVNPWASWSMDMPPYIPPGPGNPLGTRALNLSASGIRIHGTPEADSIGRPASHGCIRMFMHDAEELFDLVDVGTPVVVVRT